MHTNAYSGFSGTESIDTLAGRLRRVRGDESRRAFAQRMELNESTLRNYERGNSVPTADFIVKLCKTLRISPAWVLFGEGEAHSDAFREGALPGTNPAGSGPGIPVFGLLAGHAEGWHQPSPLPISLQMPFLAGCDGCFAVLATGSCLVPAGVKPAQVLICDASLRCEPEDIVFVRRRDGCAALRLLSEYSPDGVSLLSWAEPGPDGQQQAHQEQLATEELESLAAVAYIKLKG